MYNMTLIRIQQFTCAALLLALTSSPAWAIQWSGAGDGTTWTDPANWVGGNVPDTNTEDAEFGNSAPNTAQVISLPSNISVDQVLFTATGNRSYTINGAGQLSLRGWDNLSAAGTQVLTANNQVLYTAASELMYWGNGELAINGGHDRSGAGTGTVLFQIFGAGIIRLNSAWGNINGGTSNPLGFQSSFNTSEFILNSNPNAIKENAGFSKNNLTGNNLWSFADDARNAGMQLNAGGTLTVRFDGRTGSAAGTRRTLESFDTWDNGTIQFAADAPGSLVDGGLTLKTTRAFGTSMSSAIDFGAQADAILELAPPLADAPGTLIVNSTVTGAGKVVKSATGTAIVQAAWSHTGGMDVDNGTLRMNGGSLPNTGVLKVAGSAIVDLNGFSETIGGLTGNGTVRGGGATLTLNETLSPGNSPGTLTLTNISLSLGSSSDYLVEVLNTGSYDSINLFGSLTIQGGSELNVSNLPGFSVALGDSFTIVNNDGSDLVTGTFAGLTHGSEFTTGPGGLGYQILYNTGTGGNDIVLIAVPEPSAVVLLGLGGLLLGRRRVK